MNSSEHLIMASDCSKRDAQLTDWEREFIGSISSRLEHGRALGPKETEILDEIWEKATANG